MNQSSSETRNDLYRDAVVLGSSTGCGNDHYHHIMILNLISSKALPKFIKIINK